MKFSVGFLKKTQRNLKISKSLTENNNLLLFLCFKATQYLTEGLWPWRERDGQKERVLGRGGGITREGGRCVRAAHQ